MPSVSPWSCRLGVSLGFVRVRPPFCVSFVGSPFLLAFCGLMGMWEHMAKPCVREFVWVLPLLLHAHRVSSVDRRVCGRRTAATQLLSGPRSRCNRYLSSTRPFVITQVRSFSVKIQLWQLSRKNSKHKPKEQKGANGDIFFIFIF